MLSRLIRYVGAASVSVSVSSIINIPPRPFVSYLRSFSSMTTTTSIHPEIVAACKTGFTASNMFHLLLSLDSSPVSDYNYILSSIYDMGDIPLLFSLAQQMKFQNIHTWTILLRCHCHEDGNISSAFSLFQKIINTGHHPTTSILNHLLNSLYYRGHIRKALVFYHYITLKGFQDQLDLETYFILIMGLCETGDTQLAISMLRQLPHDIDIYFLRSLHNSIIRRMCNDKLVNQAYALCSQMIVNKIMPDCLTYRHLIYGHCITGQFKQAIALFRELEPSGNNDPTTPLPTLVTQLKLSNYIITYGVPTLVTEQEVKATKRAVAELIKRRVKPNLASCQSVIGGLYKGGRVKIAREVERLSLALSEPSFFEFGQKLVGV